MPWIHFFQILFILKWNLISFHSVLYYLGRWYNNILRNIQVLMQLEEECFFKWKANCFHDWKYKSVHVREAHLFSPFSNSFTFLTCISWTNVIFLQVIAYKQVVLILSWSFLMQGIVKTSIKTGNVLFYFLISYKDLNLNS